MGVTPYIGVTSLTAKQVCSGPVKRKTCKDFLQKDDVLSSFICTFKEQTSCTLSHGIFWSFYGGRSIQKRGKTRKNFTTFMRFF